MPKMCTDFSISSILNLGGGGGGGGNESDCKEDEEYKEIEELSKKNNLEMENMKFSDSSSNSPPRKKKTRTVFTRQQIQYLENAFDRKKYFTNTERQKLASNLMLSETQVKIWLQNRRNKWKKQIHHEPPTSTPYIQTNYAPLIREHLPLVSMDLNGRKDVEFQTSPEISYNKNQNLFLTS